MSGVAWTEAVGVQVLRFPFLEAQAPVIAGFTARAGGVSRGEKASLNLSYSVGDSPAAVAENRRRAFQAFGLAPEQAVLAGLVHGNAVARVSSPPAGWPWHAAATAPAGVPLRWREGSGFIGAVDGLVTDRPEVGLVITAADCVPLYLVDPVRPAIGAGHAGWRGTVRGVATALVQRMTLEFGSDPARLWAVVGPAIGPCHYEVDEPVMAPLRAALPDQWQALARPAAPGKWHLDLWECNRRQLVDAGLPAEQVLTAGVCTCCERRRLFSHRGQAGQAGRGAAILALVPATTLPPTGQKP